jgi:hypothetical protein
MQSSPNRRSDYSRRHRQAVEASDQWIPGATDLPLVASWLTRPHLAEWWSGPIDLEPGLDQFLVMQADSTIATSAARHSYRRRLYRYVEGTRAQLALERRSCDWARARRALMLSSAASATRWSSACSITAMTGDADQFISWVHRRDRVLANDR